LSEEKEVDEGEILKALVKQGAFNAARAYVDFLEEKAEEIKRDIKALREKMPQKEAEKSEPEGSAEGEETGEG